MDLQQLSLTKRMVSGLNAKNITSVEDLLRFFPLRYYDFTRYTGILPKDQVSCISGYITNMKKSDSRTFAFYARVQLDNGSECVVTWFHMPYLYDRIYAMKGSRVLICGKFNYSAFHKCQEAINPVRFTTEIEENMKVVPVYPKINGIKAGLVPGIIKSAMRSYGFTDFYGSGFRDKYGICSLYEAARGIHEPSSMEQVQRAEQRILFDDMLYFAMMEKKLEKGHVSISPYSVKKLSITTKIIKNLPFRLSDDQNKVFSRIIQDMVAGRRVNGLIQGDVGCGKSIICFLLAVALAENGYQSAIMAPNKVLSLQHYKSLLELTSGTGIVIGHYTGDMPAKEKRALFSMLKDGEINIIVGTTSLISKQVEYKDLAMAVVDEEHKFGVMQREGLAEKGQEGIHTLVMTATPIPRTLAQAIYNKNLELYTITTMPEGRKRVLSCVTDSQGGVYNFLRQELCAGHQAYIVCAMIDNDDDSDVLSIEEAEALYGPFINGLGYRYATLTGKTDKDDLGKYIDAFTENKLQVLLATSVIEVGVNVPNATAIIIHNAERFGIASLHQMRGRVGRGNAQSYCVFFSQDTKNPRLAAVSQTTDGSKIAMKDLEMRSAGDLLRGTRQSGNNRYLELILANQERYRDVQDALAYLEKSGESGQVLEKMQGSFYRSDEEK